MHEFLLKTTQRCELVKIDAQVRAAVRESGAQNGIVTIFCPHTTAGITINENADPDVCHDLLGDLARLVPERQPYYQHAEGNSDAHLKALLTGSSAQVILQNAELQLGTWQSLYFAEFDGPRSRKVQIAITSE